MFKWHHQTTFLTLVGVSSLMVFSVTLFLAGYMSGQHVGYRVAQQKVAEVFPSSQAPVYVLNGVITELRPDAIVMEAQRVTANPLDDGPKMRTVMVGIDTVVRQVTLKEPKDLDAEAVVYSKQFQQAHDAGTAPPSAPLPYTIYAMEFGQLHVGDRVEVRSKSDLRLADQFTAESVYRHGSGQQQ